MNDKNTASLQEKLMLIQTALKVPKNETGRFGKHRNVEGILETVKPLLKEQELVLLLDTEIVNLGGKNYIKATATIASFPNNLPGNSYITANAYAMEGEINRGLDAPQVTGSATSYARKYALGGLFAIDDGKDDPDSHKDAPPEKDIPKIATGPQKFELQKLMKAKGIDEADQMQMFVESVINKRRVETQDEYQQIKDALNETEDSNG